MNMSAVPDLRPRELLALWSELDDAYHGRNGYGGDVAELYAYRFDVYSPFLHGFADSPPSTDIGKDLAESAKRERARRLYELLTLFAAERDCNITVDGRRLGRWLMDEDFDHRAHVTVKQRRIG